METIVNIEGVSKSFGSIKAVSDLDLTVDRADVLGFLGPNGSGKSTSIRMLLSLIKPDAGNIEIFGQSVRHKRLNILSRVGALVEQPNFYEYLSARKNLEILMQYSGKKPEIKRIDEVLDMLGLLDRAGSKVKTYSKGMKQRLGIAQALVHDPELLVLDEPSSGLDPSGMKDVRELIRYLNEHHGKTILLSSHQLHEIEMISNRMIIIDKGRKIVEGTVEELLQKGEIRVEFEVNEVEKALSILQKEYRAMEIIMVDGGLQADCQRSEVHKINKLLNNNGIEVAAIVPKRSLEEYFLSLT